MKLDVGNRVKLTIQNKYYPAKNNPVVGSEFECIGTVSKFFIEEDNTLIVSWDNGRSNLYNENELTLHNNFKDDNPNRTYKMKATKPQVDMSALFDEVELPRNPDGSYNFEQYITTYFMPDDT